MQRLACNMLSRVGLPRVSASNRRRLTSQIRQSDGRYAASCMSSGERFQEFLAEVVTQQSHDEMGGEPTSRCLRRVGRQTVHPQQRFEPLEGEFDLPVQAIDREHLSGGIAVGCQRGAQDHELRRDQAARIERLLLARCFPAQLFAGRLGGLALDNQAQLRIPT